MKNLRIYNTETERTTDISNMSLPYIQVVRDTDYSIFGNGAGAYIQDGLVFQLDGIHKGPTADAWTDLVGGKVFTNTGCTPLVNGWQITNTTSTYNSLRNTDTLTLPQASYTIEVCYNSTKTTGLMFIPKDANNISLGLVAQTRFIWTTGTTNELSISSGTLAGLHTVSANASRGLLDGVTQLTKSGSNSWSRGTYNGIGARSTNATYSFNGTIYAIRIYNRQLSYDEMTHNQKEDIRRFF